ncbi:hypothetical protein [Streptomyces sp. G44]|nr:hypothetical protein [Streptomyces sp. G44]
MTTSTPSLPIRAEDAPAAFAERFNSGGPEAVRPARRRLGDRRR